MRGLHFHTITKLAAIVFLNSLLSCQTEYCQMFYDALNVCETHYGITLSYFSSLRSLTDCVVMCSRDSACLSVTFDNKTRICRTNREILLYPSLNCSETVLYAFSENVSVSLNYCDTYLQYFIIVLYKEKLKKRSFSTY